MRTSFINTIAVMILISCCNRSWAETDPWTESYRLEALGQYSAAAKALEPALSQDSKNEFAMLRHGWMSYLSGEHNQSIKDYKTAIQINSSSLDAQLGILLPLMAQQRWNDAASYANQVLKVAPWNYYAHVRLMICEEGLRQWESLAKHAQQVHLRYPSDATVLVYLARSQRWLGNMNEARRAYQEVLQRIPGHIEALQFIASAGG